MAPWSNFYVLVGTAAATLTGLMFIALTFGESLVTPQTMRATRGILSPIFFHFVHAFGIACVALVPTEGPWLLGLTVLITAVVKLITLPETYRQLERASQTKDEIDAYDWIYGIVLPVVLALTFIISGAALLMGYSWAHFGIAGSVIGVVILGVVSTWDMLIWMASRV